MGGNNFTKKQMEVGRQLMVDLTEKYPNASIHGHNEFTKKLCPVFDIKIIIPYEG